MRETPGSFIVTPIQLLAISIAIRLCEIKRNCRSGHLAQDGRNVQCSDHPAARQQSSRQNGAGFNWKNANTSAVAVSAFAT